MMERFDAVAPQRLQEFAAIQAQIAQEQAAGLGITGRRLAHSIESYRQAQQHGASSASVWMARIAQDLSELLIQREAIGLPHHNLEWILGTYPVPQEVLTRLGLRAHTEGV